MPASRLMRLLLLLSLPLGLPAQSPDRATVLLTPSTVLAGSPELLRVSAPDAKAIDGEWLGRKIQFFPSHDRRIWFALTGVDVEAPVAPSTLVIHVHLSNNA